MAKKKTLPTIGTSLCDNCSKLITFQYGVWKCSDGGYMGVYTKAAIKSCKSFSKTKKEQDNG